MKIMLPYCVKCKENTEDTDVKVLKTSYGKTMILSKCAVCNTKKSRFIEKQEAKGLLKHL